MDILIKGIKGLRIPTERRLVLVIESDGEVWFPNDYKVTRSLPSSVFDSKTTRAVALPEHGRLISDTDVKALFRSGLSLDTDSDMDYVCGLIDELPTIVEASE